MSLKLNSSGGGSVTLQEPSTASNVTLTLPATTGTVALQGGAGVGKVLQVVQSTTTTQTTSSSTTLVDSGLSATITPTSASSQILVIVSQSMLTGSSSGNVTINRAGTDVATFGYGSGLNGQGSNSAFYQSMQWFDSPATTSATIYKTRFNRVSGAGTITAQYTDGNGTMRSVITLLEIAA